jgi:undecaprenyl-diphosphatase
MIRRPLLAAGATALAFAVLTALVVLRVPPVIRLDTAVTTAALHAALGAPAWRSLMVAVTNTGGPVVVSAAAALAAAALIRLRRFRDAMFVAVAVLSPVLLRLIVLNVIARPRPPEGLAPSAGWSYPSGHATASAAAALALILVVWPHLRRRLWLAIPAGWAFAVGLSRVALSVHWLTDVLGAWLFASALVAASLPLRAPPSPASPGAQAPTSVTPHSPGSISSPPDNGDAAARP